MYGKRSTPRLQQKPSGYWSIRFYDRRHEPKEKWISTGIRSDVTKTSKNKPPLPVQSLRERLTRLWYDNEYDPWTDHLQYDMPMDDAVRLYFAECERKGFSAQTMKAYKTTILPFNEYLQPKTLVESVTPEQISRWLDKGDKAPSTHDAYRNRLKTFFIWCVAHNLRRDNPVDGVPRVRIRTVPREILLPSELILVFRAVEVDCLQRPDRDVLADLYAFAASTGLRRGEVCSREWRHISGDMLEVCATSHFELKGPHSRRRFKMNRKAQAIIAKRAKQRRSEDPGEPIFVAPKGGFVDKDWATKRWKAYREQTGINKKAPLHATRHTFITYSLALGTPVPAVMRLVGITKLETIMVYTHMAEELLGEAPEAAIARHLPGHVVEESPLLRDIALWFNNQYGDALVSTTERVDGRPQ